MKKSILTIVFLSFLSIGFSQQFVTAESGLLCRESPNGRVVGKFAYGTAVEVIEFTKERLSIVDDGKEISGFWVKVKGVSENTMGYVFNGFLTYDTHYELDVEKIAQLTPAQFAVKTDNRGLILAGTHNIYDEDLNIAGELKINEISEVEINSFTLFERPKTRSESKRKQWIDYCEWANYVNIAYKGNTYIVFGSNVLEVKSESSYEFKGEPINFLEVSSFIKKTGTLTEELSGCGYGRDLLIWSNDVYSLVPDFESEEPYYLSFAENEGGYDELGKVEVKRDTLYSKVSQGFQEGTGEYKIKFFQNNGWKFIAYDVVRDYEGRW